MIDELKQYEGTVDDFNMTDEAQNSFCTWCSSYSDITVDDFWGQVTVSSCYKLAIIGIYRAGQLYRDAKTREEKAVAALLGSPEAKLSVNKELLRARSKMPRLLRIMEYSAPIDKFLPLFEKEFSNSNDGSQNT